MPSVWCRTSSVGVGTPEKKKQRQEAVRADPFHTGPHHSYKWSKIQLCEKYFTPGFGVSSTVDRELGHYLKKCRFNIILIVNVKASTCKHCSGRNLRTENIETGHLETEAHNGKKVELYDVYPQHFNKRCTWCNVYNDLLYICFKTSNEIWLNQNPQKLIM